MDTDEEIRAVRARMAMRDNERLRADLEFINEVGWGHTAATSLLRLVREELVRPMVIGEGLRGFAAWQAEATGWAVAWEELRSPALLQAASPWGVVWSAVRHAVRAEVVSAQYCTGARHGWTARRSGGAHPRRPVVSLERLRELGYEPSVEDELSQVESGDRRVYVDALEVVVGVLCAAGWESAAATRIVGEIARLAERGAGATRRKDGWRSLAARLDLPQWRVRRVMVLMLGEPGWEGLLARVLRDGVDVTADVGVRAAARSTVVGSMRPPRRVAALALERDARGLLDRAS